jgi:hypothetical protein
MSDNSNLWSKSSSIDGFLSGGKAIGKDFQSVRNLTDSARAAASILLPVSAGTRVAFKGNIGSYLAYDNPPADRTEGTVVTVRSAAGTMTSHEGMVFVKWDNGAFSSIHAEHLRRIGGQNKLANVMRIASLGDLGGFLKLSNETLIHKSTHDLWSFKKSGEEGFIVERLFDDNGKPLKA